MDTSNVNGDKLKPEQQDQLLLMMLVQQYQQIAMMGLGKIKNPATDSIERDLKSARFAVDTLNMLQKYTKGNLDKELESYLTQTLTTLRLNYADESKKGEDPASGEDKDDDENKGEGRERDGGQESGDEKY